MRLAATVDYIADSKLQPIVLKFLPISYSMLLSSAQKVDYYAQYYAHNYCNYATVQLQLDYYITNFL